jgi:hypothetical protein
MARLDQIRSEQSVEALAQQLKEVAGPIVAFEETLDDYTSVKDIIEDFEKEMELESEDEAGGNDGGKGEDDPPDGLGVSGGYTQTLFQRPKQLGVALKSNKMDKKDTRMQMGLHLFEPLRVYFSLMQWPKTAHLSPSGGVTWLELMLDFWCCTRVEMKPMGRPKTGCLRAQTELFRAASRRVARICGARRLTEVHQTHKATSLSAYGQEWATGFSARPLLLFGDMVHKMLIALQRRTEQDGAEDRNRAFWEGDIPWVELPDPIWTVDGRYDILTGGTRPGGALNILWEKIHAEVEESNQKAITEGLHLIQLPGAPDGVVSCTRCGLQKPWQHFHTFARRRCKGAARALGDDGQPLQPWKDKQESLARTRRKGIFARRRAKLCSGRPGISAVELDCLVGTEEHPRPCDPTCVRVMKARRHAERIRRVASGAWPAPTEVPDRRVVLDLPAVVSRQQLEEEMMAWDRDRRANQGMVTYGRAAKRKPVGSAKVRQKDLQAKQETREAVEKRRKERRKEVNRKYWAKSAKPGTRRKGSGAGAAISVTSVSASSRAQGKGKGRKLTPKRPALAGLAACASRPKAAGTADSTSTTEKGATRKGRLSKGPAPSRSRNGTEQKAPQSSMRKRR